MAELRPRLRTGPNKRPDAMQTKRRNGRTSTKTSVEDEIAHLRGLDLKGLRSRWQFVADLQHVDGMDFHQRFQPLCQRRFSTAHRAQQIENLLALFQTLGCVPEEADDAL